jgi:hypothetical protein
VIALGWYLPQRGLAANGMLQFQSLFLCESNGLSNNMRKSNWHSV